MTASKDDVARRYAAELAAMARDVLHSNRYVVLGTAHPGGHPRVSPVFFGHHAHRALYWVSSPDSQHSRNLAADDRVSAVVFDSTTPPPQNRAVYLTGTAAEVPAAELRTEVPRAFARSTEQGARAFTVEELSGDGDLRLYRRRDHRRGARPRRSPGVGDGHRHAAAGADRIVPDVAHHRNASWWCAKSGTMRKGRQGAGGR